VFLKLLFPINKQFSIDSFLDWEGHHQVYLQPNIPFENGNNSVTLAVKSATVSAARLNATTNILMVTMPLGIQTGFQAASSLGLGHCNK